MCLEIVTQTKGLPEKMIGYQVKRWYADGSYGGCCISIPKGKLGDILAANHCVIGWGHQYEAGFHLFNNKKDAFSHWLFDNNNKVVVKVEATLPICRGFQDCRDVYVYGRIKLLEEVRND